MESFKKKQNSVDGKEQYQVKITKMFPILEILNYCIFIDYAHVIYTKKPKFIKMNMRSIHLKYMRGKSNVR
jgi:hypothetical protein